MARLAGYRLCWQRSDHLTNEERAVGTAKRALLASASFGIEHRQTSSEPLRINSRRRRIAAI
jgi:hypothetical protein